MMPFSLTIQNLRVLRQATWSPAPVSVLVGPNASGKTTLLNTLRFLANGLSMEVWDALGRAFGGSQGLANHSSTDRPIRLSISFLDYIWSVSFRTPPSGIELGAETLHEKDRLLFRRDGTGSIEFEGKHYHPSGSFGIGHLGLADAPLPPEVQRFFAYLATAVFIADVDLRTMRDGSRVTDNQFLTGRGRNAVTMLRKWHQTRPSRARYDFVLSGLRTAFPDTVADIDFVEAGAFIAMRFYRPGMESAEALSEQANGVLAMLVYLCALASAPDDGLVVIDEPENSLHPFAIRVLIRLARGLAATRRVTVLLSTHSPVVLGEFDDEPSAVFAVGSDVAGPTPVTELRKRAWLARFSLGELLGDYEFGSNG